MEVVDDAAEVDEEEEAEEADEEADVEEEDPRARHSTCPICRLSQTPAGFRACS